MTTRYADSSREQARSPHSSQTGAEVVRHLYVHIPFCPRKCSYCAFVTHVGSVKLLESYLWALKQELSWVGAEHVDSALNTIYFGGGTPSVLTGAQVKSLLRHIKAEFEVGPALECTLEAHPSTVDQEKLDGYRQAGINRISFGAETLDAGELTAVGRSYSVERVFEILGLSRAAGFADIALDLMYGLPGQTHESWQHTLQAALSAGVDHFSLYPLAVEPYTVFARRQREGSLLLPSDETVVEMYLSACEMLRRHGYEHYEVSNWARPGHRCRHNESYWYNRQCHAVGVGAHGYVKPFRYQHVRQTKRYIDLTAAARSTVTQREPIPTAIERSETIMLRLRLLQDGLNLDELRSRFGDDLEQTHALDIRELRERGLLTLSDRTLRLTEAAVPMANEVWQRFM